MTERSVPQNRTFCSIKGYIYIGLDGPSEGKNPSVMDLTIFGYEIGEVIAEGTFSVVRKAFSHKLQRSVAIKIIDKSKQSDDFLTKCLPREVSIFAECSHPNIIKVYQIIDSNEHTLFIMEEAKRDLFDLVDSQGHLSEEVARPYFKQISQALEYCHIHHIAHRDIKCENILITIDNIPKLTDFGLATCIKGSESCPSSTFCGSAAYAAPEILNGEKYDPFKADIWSLGVLLYVMVTGCMPFDDSDLSKLKELQKAPVFIELRQGTAYSGAQDRCLCSCERDPRTVRCLPGARVKDVSEQL
ncbi:testis-specific serine/threonine-protein kinase 6-like [Rhincodon typus]|uniref:testis-specific serine/threonine-protein kinase 6-like n=1 Tax=Rhincodon typus TaxID=259920 RepID=UPI0020302C2A|nr:testis-specific serine/threonine-protein kinase 6-like [Rhincodon typus]